jgi:hypothetical protein
LWLRASKGGKALNGPESGERSHRCLFVGVCMSICSLRYGLISAILTAALFYSSSVFAQARRPGNLGPPLRPMLQMTGFVNPSTVDADNRPVVTLALPGQKKHYRFLVTDTKLLAGPLRTPSDIFAEVKPYTTSFYLRGPQKILSQITTATSTDRLTITGEYSRNGRFLFVQSIEPVEDSKK